MQVVICSSILIITEKKEPLLTTLKKHWTYCHLSLYLFFTFYMSLLKNLKSKVPLYSTHHQITGRSTFSQFLLFSIFVQIVQRDSKKTIKQKKTFRGVRSLPFLFTSLAQRSKIIWYVHVRLTLSVGGRKRSIKVWWGGTKIYFFAPSIPSPPDPFVSVLKCQTYPWMTGADSQTIAMIL